MKSEVTVAYHLLRRIDQRASGNVKVTGSEKYRLTHEEYRQTQTKFSFGLSFRGDRREMKFQIAW